MADDLSNDAKVICGMWGFGPKFELTFHTPSRIHRRTKAALDELVEQKLITVEPFNDFGGLVYKGTPEAYETGRKLSQAAVKRLLDSSPEGEPFPVAVESGDHPDAWGDKRLDTELNARRPRKRNRRNG